MEKIQEQLLEKLPLLKEATKLSASSAFKVAKTILVFAIFNLIFLIIGLVYLFKGEIVFNKILLVIGMLVLGIVSTFFAATKMYHQVLINAGKVYFEKLDVFKINFANTLIEKLESGINTNTGKKVNQIVNVSQIISNSYENVPKIISKAISYLISKIPLMEYVEVLNNEFLSKGKEEKVNFLVTKTNTFFDENVFSVNNVKTIRIVFFIMVLVQIGLIYFIRK